MRNFFSKYENYENHSFPIVYRFRVIYFFRKNMKTLNDIHIYLVKNLVVA